jgi:hypothetical protein
LPSSIKQKEKVQQTQPHAPKTKKPQNRSEASAPDCASVSLAKKRVGVVRRESQSSGKIFTCDKWLIKFPAQPRRWRRKKWNARRKKRRVLCFVVAAFKLKNEKVRAG